MKSVFLFFAVCVAVAIACQNDNECHCPPGQSGFCDQSSGHCHCRDDIVGRALPTCTDDDLSACSCEHGGTPVCRNGDCHCEHHIHP